MADPTDPDLVAISWLATLWRGRQTNDVARITTARAALAKLGIRVTQRYLSLPCGQEHH